MYYFRCGWQFYELRKIITGNFVKTAVDLMGITENATTTEMSEVLPEEVEEKANEAAENSMGTEISE